MSPIFRTGDKALLLPPSRDSVSLLSPEYIGTHVTVMSELMSVRELTTMPVDDVLGHIIEMHDGSLAWVVPRILQKLPPAPPKWNAIALRDDLVRDEKRPARVPHPAIAGLLDLVGQSPIQAARKALGL